MFDVKSSIDYDILPVTSAGDDYFYVNVKFRDPRSSYEEIEEMTKVMANVFHEFVKFLEKDYAICQPIFSCTYNYREFNLKFCTRSKALLKEFAEKDASRNESCQENISPLP